MSAAHASDERAKYARLAPDARKAYSALGAYLKACGLEPGLLDLVFVRVSQVNGCSFCLQMHTREALDRGERPERLFQLDAWQESPVFSEREKAALAWADALTLVHQRRASNEEYARSLAQFTEKELVDLSWAIVYINGWNRMAIGFRTPPEIDGGASTSLGQGR
jgi:AhpD family alkylhydroperoxidase